MGARYAYARYTTFSCVAAVLCGIIFVPPAHGQPRDRLSADNRFDAAPALIINEDFADPGVLKTDNGYVAFSTSSAKGKVPVASASQPQGPWSIRGDALKNKPKWATNDTGFWAPDVVRRPDGTYVLYFSATSVATHQMCIGAAIGTEAEGPYEPHGDTPLVCIPEDLGNIDPDIFINDDGRRYLLYKSNGAKSGAPAALWLQEIAADGLALIGERRELLRADLHVEKTVVEAPLLVRQPEGFILFYSADTFQSSGYHTSYATAETLIGPYVKSDNPLISKHVLKGEVDGPGGADIAGGHIFFHGWLQPEHKTRGMFMLPIAFENGVPRLPA